MNRVIVKYRLKLLMKRAAAGVLGLGAPAPPRDAPAVTLYVVSYNTRHATELSLRSMRRYTRYPNYSIQVIENGSKDGSLEALRELRDELGFDLVESREPRLHAHWLDHALQTAATPFWFAVDSDLALLGHDWLSDMMRRFEADPGLFLVGAEAVPGGVGVEPVGGKKVEAGEHVSTWLFGVRSGLREHVGSSFAFHVEGIDPESGLERVYDSGGKLLSDMRERGLRYGYMPVWFLAKYYHFGSLSWAFNYEIPADRRDLKAFQLSDIERWAKRLASRHVVRRSREQGVSVQPHRDSERGLARDEGLVSDSMHSPPASSMSSPRPGLLEGQPGGAG